MEESASETEMPECLTEFPVLQRSPLETSESTVSSDAESEVSDEEPGASEDGGEKMGRQNNVQTVNFLEISRKKFANVLVFRDNIIIPNFSFYNLLFPNIHSRLS